jgi:hypothetical protein
MNQESYAIGYEARATLDPELNRRLWEACKPYVELKLPWYWRFMTIKKKESYSKNIK